MTRRNDDPFGFSKAINWDAVDQHAEQIAAIFDRNERPNLGQDGQTS